MVIGYLARGARRLVGGDPTNSPPASAIPLSGKGALIQLDAHGLPFKDSSFGTRRPNFMPPLEPLGSWFARAIGRLFTSV